jgi:hypothetical protein
MMDYQVQHMVYCICETLCMFLVSEDNDFKNHSSFQKYTNLKDSQLQWWPMSVLCKYQNSKMSKVNYLN